MIDSQDTILVSIIMPTYNRADLIMDTIASIRAQTFTNWELIIVDDGSDDHSDEIVAGVNDRRIIFHKAGRTGIIGRLKNVGLSIAKGSWIAFMDSDDLWAPGKLEKQLEAVTAYPKARFSLTGGYSFHEPGKPVDYYYKQHNGKLAGNILPAFFRGEIAALMPSLLFKKECLERTGKFEESRLFSDIAFMLKLAEYYEGVILYEPLLFRRLHATNITNNNWELGYSEYIDLIHDYTGKRSIPRALSRQSLYLLYIRYGEKCLRYKMRKKAFKMFLQAWRNNPASIIPLKKMGKSILG